MTQQTIDEKIGAIIRNRRQDLGLTQAALGKLINVTFQQVQKYENGTNSLSAARLVQIARALKMPIEELFNTNVYTAHASDREALEMMKAYKSIPDYDTRKSISNLVRAIAG